MGISIEVFKAASVEGGGTPDDAMYFIALGKQKFSEVTAILTGDPGDEGDLAFLLDEVCNDHLPGCLFGCEGIRAPFIGAIAFQVTLHKSLPELGKIRLVLVNLIS